MEVFMKLVKLIFAFTPFLNIVPQEINIELTDKRKTKIKITQSFVDQCATLKAFSDYFLELGSIPAGHQCVTQEAISNLAELIPLESPDEVMNTAGQWPQKKILLTAISADYLGYQYTSSLITALGRLILKEGIANDTQAMLERVTTNITLFSAHNFEKVTNTRLVSASNEELRYDLINVFWNQKRYFYFYKEFCCIFPVLKTHKGYPEYTLHSLHSTPSRPLVVVKNKQAIMLQNMWLKTLWQSARKLTLMPSCEQLSNDGTLIAFNQNNCLYLEKLTTTDDKTPSDPLESPEKNITALKFNNDGSMLAAGTENGTLCVWETSTDKLIHNLTEPDNTTAIKALTFRDNSSTLLAGHENSRLKEWNLQTKTLTKKVKIGPSEISLLVLNAQETILATTGSGTTINLLNPVNPEKRIGTLVGSMLAVECLAFHPNGRILASGGLDKTLRLWDVSTKTLIRTVGTNHAFLNGVLFSLDGKNLFSLDQLQRATTWTLETIKNLEQTKDYNIYEKPLDVVIRDIKNNSLPKHKIETSLV